MMRRKRGLGRALAICIWTAASLVLGGCAADLVSDPVNRPLLTGAAVAPLLQPRFDGPADDVIIGLSFSGGGTRAAAFAHGVLKEMSATDVRLAGRPSHLVDHVKFVSGVSGGAVAAAYFGLKGPAAVENFRERFLLKNAEEDLRTSLVNPKNLVRVFAGGANDSTGLPRWLDQNLFDGATFDDLMQPDKPVVIINASDIFSRVPFVFGPLTFSAFCSDIRSYPLSQAVAASAAVPVVFAPVVIKTYPGRCQAPLPAWLEKVREDPGAPSNLRAFANAIHRYRTGEIGFIKLLDGGLTDNFGLRGFLVTRLGAQTPYGPLSARDAVRIRELALFVVNAGAARQATGCRRCKDQAAARCSRR